MKHYKNSFPAVLVLIMALSVMLAYVGSNNSVFAQLFNSNHSPKDTKPVHTDLVSIRAQLVQDKVLKGSDGQIAVSLTLDAAKIPRSDHQPFADTDLVIVLDRSGSMAGRKLSDARLAVMQLIDRMTAVDRLAIITYSNGVQVLSPLAYMDEANKHHLKTVIAQVNADGGTNLGAGLKYGIQTLMQTPATNNRQRRVILISDGQANQGITDPLELGDMASAAATQNVAVSTVGVGLDFNEILMTTLADHGSGRYYFLEDPKKFALVFNKEFQDTRNIAASAVEILVPLRNEIRLVHAAGYPIQVNDGLAVIRPGDLLSGQQRNLFLTFQVPTDKEAEYNLGEFQVRFNHNSAAYRNATSGQMVLSCVKDSGEVTASIDEPAWSARVIQEDFSQLKEGVADAISKGEKDKAMDQIQEYEMRNEAINATVGSTVVAGNLKTDVQALRQSVEETFAGTPAVVAEKKKQNSKALQYESYQIRRDKK